MWEKRTILLAEDEPNDVFLMERAVRKMAAPVALQPVRDGEEAIEYLSGQGKFADRDRYPLPDLIVLDIKMPRKNGFDVLEWLRHESALTHIPVMMLASSKVRSDADKARELGASAYLVKPASLDELKRLFTAPEEYLAAHGRKSLR